MVKLTRALAAAIPLALVMAACGGDGAATSIEAEMEDFQFTPTEWTVKAGEEITIELTNNGAVEHEWVLLQPGVTISSEADLPETEEELLADFVYWEDEVESGETKTLTFTAPVAGTYQVICAIPDHFNAGMNATLTAE